VLNKVGFLLEEAYFFWDGGRNLLVVASTFFWKKCLMSVGIDEGSEINKQIYGSRVTQLYTS